MKRFGEEIQQAIRLLTLICAAVSTLLFVLFVILMITGSSFTDVVRLALAMAIVVLISLAIYVVGKQLEIQRGLRIFLLAALGANGVAVFFLMAMVFRTIAG